MNGDRKPKAPIARQLRQEAGFGCCVCGNPIYQHHHIVPYTEEDPHYRLEDMMILCPNHHTECHDYKINPTLSIQEQREAKEKPYNIVNGFVGGFLKVSSYQVKMGNLLLTLIKGAKISFANIDQEAAFRFSVGDENILEISGMFYDKEGNLLATLEGNNFISEAPFPWDIQFKHQWLKISLKPRNIFLEIDAHISPIQVKADVWYKKDRFVSHLVF